MKNFRDIFNELMDEDVLSSGKIYDKIENEVIGIIQIYPPEIRVFSKDKNGDIWYTDYDRYTGDIEKHKKGTLGYINKQIVNGVIKV